MNVSYWSNLFTPSFFHELETVGVASAMLLPPPSALALAEYISDHPFSARAENYGKRAVFQQFAACEEEDIPLTSPVRTIARALGQILGEVVAMKRTNLFSPPLQFNDHLLLKYRPGEVGLGVHRDYSKYKNLIVSLTLTGTADFNLHEHPDGPPVKSFACSPGIAVFMRAPGFLQEDIRPYHSVTAVSAERTSVIFKQKEA